MNKKLYPILIAVFVIALANMACSWSAQGPAAGLGGNGLTNNARQVVVYSIPDDGTPLKDNGNAVGYAKFPGTRSFTLTGPKESLLFIALGNGDIDGVHYAADKTTGNIVAKQCDSDECSMNAANTSAGHTGATVVFPGANVNYNNDLGNAAKNMLTKPNNCGDHACNTVNFWVGSTKVATFTKADSNTLTISYNWKMTTVDISTVSDPDAQVEKSSSGNVEGHTFQSEGQSKSVAVSEGGTTLLYFKSDGSFNFAQADGTYNDATAQNVKKGQIVVLKGNPGDGTTPEDKNKTVQVYGDVQVSMLTVNGTAAQPYIDALKTKAKGAGYNLSVITK